MPVFISFSPHRGHFGANSHFLFLFFLLHRCIGMSNVSHLHQTPTAAGGPEWPAEGIGGAFISIVCIKVSVSKSPPKLHGRLHSEHAAVSSAGKKKRFRAAVGPHAHRLHPLRPRQLLGLGCAKTNRVSLTPTRCVGQRGGRGGITVDMKPHKGVGES